MVVSSAAAPVRRARLPVTGSADSSAVSSPQAENTRRRVNQAAVAGLQWGLYSFLSSSLIASIMAGMNF